MPWPFTDLKKTSIMLVFKRVWGHLLRSAHVVAWSPSERYLQWMWWVAEIYPEVKNWIGEFDIIVFWKNHLLLIFHHGSQTPDRLLFYSVTKGIENYKSLCFAIRKSIKCLKWNRNIVFSYFVICPYCLIVFIAIDQCLFSENSFNALNVYIIHSQS